MFNLLDAVAALLGQDGFDERFNLKGSMKAELIHADGTVEVRKKENLIVNAGFDFICNAIGATSRPALMSHIGVGTGTTAPAVADTALQTQLGSRLAAAYAHTAGTKVFTFAATFNPGVCTGAITEAGVFNDATAGIMLDRVTFSVINKGADDTLTITFQFTLS